MCCVNKWWWRWWWWCAAVCALCPVCWDRWQHAQPKKEHPLCAKSTSWTWFPPGRRVCLMAVIFFFYGSSVRSAGGGGGHNRVSVPPCVFLFPFPFLFLFLNRHGASRWPLPVNDAGREGASHALLAVVVLEAMSHREVEPWHSWNCYPQPEADNPLGSAC